MEGEVIEGINLDFRPDTYFPESRDRAQLLSIGLLQNRFNELGENTRLDLSDMHKSRWWQS